MRVQLLIANVRNRHWCGRKHIQKTPKAGVPVTDNLEECCHILILQILSAGRAEFLSSLSFPKKAHLSQLPDSAHDRVTARHVRECFAMPFDNLVSLRLVRLNESEN